MRKIICFFISILTIFLVGCDDKNNIEKVTVDINKIPNEFNKKIDNVTFNTQIVINKDEDVVTSTATLQKIDPDKTINLFFGERKYENKYENDCENTEGKKIKHIDYVDEYNNKVLSLGNNSSFCSFCSGSNLSRYVNNSFVLIRGDEYNADKYLTNKDFSFKSREESFKDIKNTLKSLGISITDTYKVYSLDYQTMKDEEFTIDMDGNEDVSAYNPNWNEDDNCYYFVVYQQYKGCNTYYYKNEAFNDICDENESIQILYSKDGIEKIELDKIFKFDDKNNKVKLVSFDEVAKTVSKKYSNILGTSTYEVNKAELIYYCNVTDIEQYKVIPAWAIYITCKDENGNIKNVQMMVDAQNGEEIV